jgi:hypothetical protein
MTRETKFRGGIGMSLLGLVVMTFFYFQQQDELRKCKEGNDFIQGGDIEKAKIITQRDSLYDELFYQKVESGRHELTRDYFFSKHPKLQLEYENYLNHETE